MNWILDACSLSTLDTDCTNIQIHCITSYRVGLCMRWSLNESNAATSFVEHQQRRFVEHQQLVKYCNEVAVDARALWQLAILQLQQCVRRLHRGRMHDRQIAHGAKAATYRRLSNETNHQPLTCGTLKRDGCGCPFFKRVGWFLIWSSMTTIPYQLS